MPRADTEAMDTIIAGHETSGVSPLLTNHTNLVATEA